MATTSPAATVSGFSQVPFLQPLRALLTFTGSVGTTKSSTATITSAPPNFNPRLRQLSELGDRYFRVAVLKH